MCVHCLVMHMNDSYFYCLICLSSEVTTARYFCLQHPDNMLHTHTLFIFDSLSINKGRPVCIMKWLLSLCAHISTPLLFAFFYLISFSEVLHIQAALHDDPRHVPPQDERELLARLIDIQRVSLHRQCRRTIAT